MRTVDLFVAGKIDAPVVFAALGYGNLAHFGHFPYPIGMAAPVPIGLPSPVAHQHGTRFVTHAFEAEKTFQIVAHAGKIGGGEGTRGHTVRPVERLDYAKIKQRIIVADHLGGSVQNRSPFEFAPRRYFQFTSDI